MIIDGTKVIFQREDFNFVKKFGLLEATDMVLNYRTLNDLPFIYDSYQLAAFLGLNHKYMFYFIRSDIRDSYKQITIKKKNGGDRTIHAPYYDTLFYAQKRIHKEILAKLPVSKYATAYKKGAKLTGNAEPHVGKRYLLKLDITDFFGSIRFEQAYSAAFNTKYFPKFVGVTLTKLCCLNRVLPQGAVTSPALSNLVMKNFDDNIGSWCEKHGISYTRYCDDMTFSSDKPLYAVYSKAKYMLQNMGFELNERKTHFITNSCRQTVTGLTVNEKVMVSREYKRSLRQELHYVFKYGAIDAFRHIFCDKYLGKLRPHTLYYLYSLLGRTRFVLSVEPDNEYFKTALQKLNELMPEYKSDEWYFLSIR